MSMDSVNESNIFQPDIESSKIWRKNLYSNFGYKDNYTDVTFLKSLKTNVNHRRVSKIEAIVAAGRVTELICVIFNFIVLYRMLIDNVYRPESLLYVTGFITLVAYFYYIKFHGLKGNELLVHFKTVVIFFILGYVLSPILKTLTQTISTDTINATTFLTMLIHLVFFDYKVPSAIASRALSLNAAIFGSLCLASRLSSTTHAFVLLTIAAECFVLYPTFAYTVRKDITLLYILSLIVLTIFLLTIISHHMAALFTLIVFFINGVCPFLYVVLQKHKYNIYGPWDEACISSKIKTVN